MNIEKQLTEQFNEEYERTLRIQGMTEKDIERMMSKVAEIDEEQARFAIDFPDNFEASLQSGFALEEEEIIELSKSLDEIENPVEGEVFLDESGTINPNSILLAHATNFTPQRNNSGLLIDSVGNADPKHEAFKKREDKYKEVAGINNSRFTIHFGMVGGQPSHTERLESGELDQHALEKRSILIIMPLGPALDHNTILNLGPSDTFFWDKVELPEKSIIIVKRDAVSRLKLRREDFAKYQIIISDDNPAETYKRLMSRALNKEKAKVDGLISPGPSRRVIKLKSGTLAPDMGGLSVHYHSIFQKVETISYPSLLIKEANKSNGLDQKKYIDSVRVLLVDRLIIHIIDPLKELLRDNENPAMNLTAEIRNKIILKIQPILRDNLRELIKYCKPLIDTPLEEILSKEIRSATQAPELNQFLDDMLEISITIRELNVKIFEIIPELNELLDIIKKVMARKSSFALPFQ